VSYTRRVRRDWLDRRFDDALLAIAMEAGFLYARRRVKRILRTLGRGTVLVTGVGVATAAVTAGVGALGAACGAAAWLRARARRSAAMARASAFADTPAAGASPGATTSAGSNSDGPAAPDAALESSVGP
jgi:hypothetical protein